MSQDVAHVSPEDALKSERVQFALAERAARFGYWRVRLADNFATWSPGMYKILALDPAMPADMAWLLDQVVAEDVAHLQSQINEAIKTRSQFYYRTRAKDPDVVARYVDTHGEVELGPDGRVVSIIGVCHDVTEQVIAEEARQKAEERYRVMAEQASDIIMLHEGDRIVFASGALNRILGRRPEDVQDGRYLQYVHPDDLDEAHKIRGLPRPGEVRTATYRARHADGHYVWLEATTRGVFDEATGGFLREISVTRDVSERKEQEMRMRAAQEKAEAANRAKTLFLANMSHELRTPLNAVIGFSDIMRDEVFGPLGHERYSEYATLIYDSGQLLLDLITDILDMAKIEAGKFEMNFERVDLAETIEDCVRLLRERARKGAVRIGFDPRHDALSLVADRRAVKQIMLNLLSNAVKFTKAGGHVDVEAEFAGDRIQVTVRDDGIGIPAEHLPRLGRPFEQVCDDPLLAKGGTGLGLALVHALTGKHGGTVRIESQEGAGTSVTVEFPLKPPARAQAAA
ncbi:MAG: PAS domain-containing sensor histidine kinase [Rhizomicrobium sp.]